MVCSEYRFPPPQLKWLYILMQLVIGYESEKGIENGEGIFQSYSLLANKELRD